MTSNGNKKQTKQSDFVIQLLLLVLRYGAPMWMSGSSSGHIELIHGSLLQNWTFVTTCCVCYMSINVLCYVLLCVYVC